jgi:hypothetical protein
MISGYIISGRTIAPPPIAEGKNGKLITGKHKKNSIQLNLVRKCTIECEEMRFIYENAKLATQSISIPKPKVLQFLLIPQLSLSDERWSLGLVHQAFD